MPFGRYADFDACVTDQSKDHDIESAKAICGKLQAELGGSNFVESTLDASGDLYLKYFFADLSTAKKSAVGDFNLHDDALDAADREAIGLPFSILPSRDLSIKGDFHAWSPKEGATWDDHVAFARQYSPGHIAAITRDSNIVSAGMSDIKANNGRLAVIKITDQKTRDAYLSNPALIPRQVSPGFMNMEAPNLSNIRNVRWAHLAAVPKGAYGDKATLYASCVGGNDCINHLVAASVLELDNKLSKTYCAVGASENLNQNVSSQGISGIISNQMTDTNAATPTAVSTSTGTTPAAVSTPAPVPVSTTNTRQTPGAPINTGTQRIVKLKQPITKISNESPQPNPNPNGEQPGGEGGGDDVAKLRAEVEQMRAVQQQAQRREEIKKQIPKELFINKGKFDEKAFEAEVEKRLQSGATDEAIAELYTLWMDKQKLLNAGYQLPQQQQQQQQQEGISNNNDLQFPGITNTTSPTGGSNYNYQTPTEVPMGGSSSSDSSSNNYVQNNINQLLNRVFMRSSV